MVSFLELGVDHQTGNYLSYAVNPDVSPFVGFSLVNPVFKDFFNSTLVGAEKNLTRVLNETGMDIVQLYFNMSIK